MITLLTFLLPILLHECNVIGNVTAASNNKTCWTECTKTCGGGMQVTCLNNTTITRACNTRRCPGDPEWTKCTLSCGGGIQKNIDNSSILRTCNTMPCPGDAGCLSAYLSFEHVYDHIVYDESHNGNAGTMHGCARIVSSGKFGKGLQLSEDGNVTFDVEKFSNRPTDAITISLWLNLSQVNGSHELFFTCGTPELYNMGDYHFAIEDGKVHWLEELPGGGTRFNVSSNATIKSGTWYHITGTYRQSTGRARLYINGLLSNEVLPSMTPKRSAVPKPNNTTHAQWKCANLGSSPKEKPLQGIIDEFRIFKCELLPQEIMDLYNKNTVKKFRIPARKSNSLMRRPLWRKDFSESLSLKKL